MITLTTLCEIVEVDSGVIQRWVGLSLVLPENTDAGPVFREIDVARVRLMLELQSIGIDDEALPVVMSLLDQLYGTRDQLRKVLAALEGLPASLREDLISRVGV
jgi:chaperone modulatory protein CbpM